MNINRILISKRLLIIIFTVFIIISDSLNATVKRKKGEKSVPKTISQKHLDSLKNELESDLLNAMNKSITKGGYISILKNNHYLIEIGKTYDRETLLPVASISKSFTALAILKLVEDGKLNLKTYTHQILPGFESVGNDIRVKDLLHHNSGIPYEGQKSDFEMKLENKSYQVPTPTTQVGKKYQYSNYNYRILGKIIEVISGKKPSEFIYDEILKPLELESIRFGDTYDCASGLYISPDNLLRYAGLYLKQGKFHGVGLLKKKSFKKIFSRPYPGEKYNYYGLGWHVLVSEKEKKVVSLFHSGIGDFNFGQLRIFPGMNYIFFFQTEHTGLNRKEFNLLNQKIESRLLKYIQTGT